MSRFSEHINRWKQWKKYSMNGRFYKFGVLLGIFKSPTFSYTLTDKEMLLLKRRYWGGIDDA